MSITSSTEPTGYSHQSPLNILLVSPPINSLTHPYSSLPALTASLRARGQIVTQCDLGMASMDKILSKKGIKALEDMIRRQLDRLPPGEETGKRRVTLRKALLFADVVTEEIEGAKDVLRNEPAFYDPSQYLRAHRMVVRALDLISAAYPPIRFIGESPSMGMTPTLNNLTAFAHDPLRNPFDRPMREILSPLVARAMPRIVGISVTYPWQLFFGYALARMVRDLAPEAMILMGGASIHLSEDTLRRYPGRAFERVDGYVFGEGEGPMNNLLDLLLQPEQCQGIHKNLYIDPAGPFLSNLPKGIVQVEPPADINTLPTPDYTGLNLSLYLAPEVLFLLGNTRQCYYGKCAFCSCSFGHRGRYQIRSQCTIKEDICLLVKRHGARHLFFTDDCIPPKRCGEIADILMEAGLGLFWSGELRSEKPFTVELIEKMAKSGFCYASFGNESGSQEVLNRMCKGTNPEKNAALFCRMADAGIGIDLQNFIGFPGESQAQAMETIRFLLALKGYITTCALGTFRVTHGSPVEQSPESFGLMDLELCDPESLVPTYRYHVNQGIDPMELPSFGEQFSGFLGMNFPANSFFLDGSVGSHNLLYNAHFGAAWVRENLGRFLLRPVKWDSEASPSLVEGVRWIKHEKGDLSFFNPANGAVIHIDEGDECLKFLRNKGTVLCPGFSPETEKDKKAHGYDLITLHREGMIRLDQKRENRT